MEGEVYASIHADGNQWITTARGVSLFDGANFVNFTAADGLAAGVVYEATATPDGTLWFATQTGGLLRYNSQTFAHFNVADGLLSENSSPGIQVSFGGAALAAQDGTLWFASGFGAGGPKGLVRFDGRGFERMTQVSNVVTALVQARDQSIWVGSDG